MIMMSRKYAKNANVFWNNQESRRGEANESREIRETIEELHGNEIGKIVQTSFTEEEREKWNRFWRIIQGQREHKTISSLIQHIFPLKIVLLYFKYYSWNVIKTPKE